MSDDRKPERPIREDIQNKLFDVGPDWKRDWVGMPEFVMHDTTSKHKIQVNFMTDKDISDFAKLMNNRSININTRSIWYPNQERLHGQFEYDGPPTDSRYPICIMSKGRYNCQTTGKLLDRMGVKYRFFVEETEGDKYKEYLGEDRVVVMPFHDLGQGSIPARNFIWEWAKEREYKRHWTVDDNIKAFKRTNNNRRLNVRGGGFFRAMEDFVDRYENVAMAGPHDTRFVPDRADNVTPYLLNSRVYSCILLDTTLDIRWRGKYNEDTDLSLRLLKGGYCTVLFRALIMDKGVTHTAGGAVKGMKGGNTDNVYNQGDYRKAFAESLREQHPDVVRVVWKFNRWHHQVDYSSFNAKLKLKPGVTLPASINEYGMKLICHESEK